MGGVNHGTLVKSKNSSRSGCAASRAVKCAELADKSVLDKLDHRGVIHGRVRNIVPPRERRDDEIGHAETKLRRKSLHSRGIVRIGAGIRRRQIAMQWSASRRRHAWVVSIGVDRDLRKYREWLREKYRCCRWNGRAQAAHDRMARRPRRKLRKKTNSSTMSSPSTNSRCWPLAPGRPGSIGPIPDVHHCCRIPLQ